MTKCRRICNLFQFLIPLTHSTLPALFHFPTWWWMVRFDSCTFLSICCFTFHICFRHWFQYWFGIMGSMTAYTEIAEIHHPRAEPQERPIVPTYWANNGTTSLTKPDCSIGLVASDSFTRVHRSYAQEVLYGNSCPNWLLCWSKCHRDTHLAYHHG